MNLNGFDPNSVEPAQPFEPLPEGWYQAMIIESEEKQTKAGTGSYLSLTFELMDGPGRGRKVWANLNLNNPNEKAVEIAQRDLSAICHAVGVMAPKQSSDLHDKALGIRLVLKDYNGEKKNEIKGYRAVTGGAVQKAPPANTQTQTKAAPPWGKRTGT